MRVYSTIISRIGQYAFWSILFAGIALRIIVYLQNRSLFLDEANLALNYATKNLAGLFGQLDNRQYAPPLFSVIEKVNTLLFGLNEYALRLFPLCCGIVLLWLFYRLCKKHIDPIYLWFPVALLAFSPYFVRYATEAKQYSSDALSTLILLLVVSRFPVDRFDRRAAISWAILGSTFIWFSMPTVFVLAGVGAYYIIGFRKKWKRAGWLLLPFGCWLLSFAVYFFSILQHDAATDNLRDHHAAFFFPLIPTSVEELELAWKIFLSFFNSSIGKTTLAIGWGIVSILAGIYYWYKKDKAYLALLLLPIVSCMFASGLQYYSLIPRLTLFFLPILIFLIGQGTASIFQKTHNYLKPIMLIALLAILADWQVLKYLYQPYQLEEIKPVMSYIKAKQEVGEIVYVHFEAIPAFDFYTNHHSNKEQFYIHNIYLGDWNRYSNSVQNHQGHMWLLFSHARPENVQADVAMIRERVRLLDVFEVKGASCYLVEWLH